MFLFKSMAAEAAGVITSRAWVNAILAGYQCLTSPVHKSRKKIHVKQQQQGIEMFIMCSVLDFGMFTNFLDQFAMGTTPRETDLAFHSLGRTRIAVHCGQSGPMQTC